MLDRGNRMCKGLEVGGGMISLGDFKKVCIVGWYRDNMGIVVGWDWRRRRG